MARSISSYVRDSDSLIKDLKSVHASETDRLFTFDVDAMYTSIPCEEALQAVRWFLRREDHHLYGPIISGLQIVLENTFFTFGESCWRQLRGLAMGTPVAPIVAILYLGYYEENYLLPTFRPSLSFYRRYLDDVLIIWRPSLTGDDALTSFQLALQSVPGLRWTFEEHFGAANFLDLWIVKHDDQYITRTYQKELNLYLYPVYNSAHPPQVKEGMIYGLLKKYSLQNPLREDFLAITKLFFKRLAVRGYHAPFLRSQFREYQRRNSLEEQQAPMTAEDMKIIPRNAFYKIPFDPNGLSRSAIRIKTGVQALSKELQKWGLGRIILCFQKPDNLGKILYRTKTHRLLPLALQTMDNTHAPSSLQREVRETIPNPNPLENGYNQHAETNIPNERP
jgi:hypothetical protein